MCILLLWLCVIIGISTICNITFYTTTYTNKKRTRQSSKSSPRKKKSNKTHRLHTNQQIKFTTTKKVSFNRFSVSPPQKSKRMTSENLQISITKIIVCTLPVYLFYRTQVNTLLKRWKSQKKSKKTSKKTTLEALTGNARAFFFLALYRISSHLSQKRTNNPI